MRGHTVAFLFIAVIMAGCLGLGGGEPVADCSFSASGFDSELGVSSVEVTTEAIEVTLRYTGQGAITVDSISVGNTSSLIAARMETGGTWTTYLPDLPCESQQITLEYGDWRWTNQTTGTIEPVE